MALTPGFEPGPHWWEASALTTAPSLATLAQASLANAVVRLLLIFRMGFLELNLIK